MSHYRYAIVGAGPSGLSAARALQKAGIAFDGYEAARGVGGLWDIENPRSTMYESAHLISSRTTTEFAEFPMDSTVDYPSHRTLIRYFRDFADHFGLRERFRFHTEVVRAEPLGQIELVLVAGQTRRDDRSRPDGTLRGDDREAALSAAEHDDRLTHAMSRRHDRPLHRTAERVPQGRVERVEVGREGVDDRVGVEVDVRAVAAPERRGHGRGDEPVRR